MASGARKCEQTIRLARREIVVTESARPVAALIEVIGELIDVRRGLIACACLDRLSDRRMHPAPFAPDGCPAWFLSVETRSGRVL